MPTLTFARSGKSASLSATKTVLEVAEDLDVSIDFDCRAGTCGTCKVKLLSGNCRLATDDGLSTEDRANGLILSCQAYCLDQVSVDV
jgi:ferredoxin